jgi:hypothetical protein
MVMMVKTRIPLMPMRPWCTKNKGKVETVLAISLTKFLAMTKIHTQ